MKKFPILALSIMALTFYHAHAQGPAHPARPTAQAGPITGKNDGAPMVTIGTIESAMTSREKVLAYPRLLARQLNCDIVSFSFTISANGKTWGPFEVKGAAFPEEVRDKIKETEAPPKVTITIDKIMVKCNGGSEEMAKPITVEYDH
jgi:hypothetical protein